MGIDALGAQFRDGALTPLRFQLGDDDPEAVGAIRRAVASPRPRRPGDDDGAYAGRGTAGRRARQPRVTPCIGEYSGYVGTCGFCVPMTTQNRASVSPSFFSERVTPAGTTIMSR